MAPAVATGGGSGKPTVAAQAGGDCAVPGQVLAAGDVCHPHHSLPDRAFPSSGNYSALHAYLLESHTMSRHIQIADCLIARKCFKSRCLTLKSAVGLLLSSLCLQVYFPVAVLHNPRIWISKTVQLCSAPKFSMLFKCRCDMSRRAGAGTVLWALCH